MVAVRTKPLSRKGCAICSPTSSTNHSKLPSTVCDPLLHPFHTVFLLATPLQRLSSSLTLLTPPLAPPYPTQPGFSTRSYTLCCVFTVSIRQIIGAITKPPLPSADGGVISFLLQVFVVFLSFYLLETSSRLYLIEDLL